MFIVVLLSIVWALYFMGVLPSVGAWALSALIVFGSFFAVLFG